MPAEYLQPDGFDDDAPEGVPPPLKVDPIDDAPNEIREFLESLGIGENYTCLIRRVRAGGGGWETLETMRSQLPTHEYIGVHYGPGRYTIAFTWYDGAKSAPSVGRRGKAGTKIKQITVDIPEIPWKFRHAEYVRSQEEKDFEASLDSEKRRIQRARLYGAEHSGGGGSGSIADLRQTLETLKALGIPVGGVAPQPRGIDWEKVLTAAVALAPVVLPLFQRRDDFGPRDILALMQSNQQNLISALTSKSPVETQMLGMLNTVMDTAKKAMTLHGPGAEQETDSWADKVFGLIESVGPEMLRALAHRPAAEQQSNFMLKAARGSKEFQEAVDNPEKLIALVNRLDEAYGCAATDDILSLIPAERPPETEENRERYRERDEAAKAEAAKSPEGA